MKSRFFIFFLILGFCGKNSQGQDTTLLFNDSAKLKAIQMPHRITNVLKTNPLSLIVGIIPFWTSEAMLVYETNTSLYQTVFIGVSYLFKSPILSLAEDDTSIFPSGANFRVSGWRIQGGYKFYINGWMKHKRDKLKGMAPKGLYVAPHISYATAKIDDNYLRSHGEYLRITYFNIDIRTGYQLIARKFAFDVFTGFGFMNNDAIFHDRNNNKQSVVDSDSGYMFNSYLKIVFGFHLGYAF